MSDMMKNAELWDALARLVGYNELARNAKTVGEKMYLQLARDEAQKVYEGLGGKIDLKASPPEIVVQTSPPFIALDAEDIALMREAIDAFDQKRQSTDSKLSAATTLSKKWLAGAINLNEFIVEARKLAEAPAKPAAEPEECRVCRKPIVRDGSRWIHADGKTYRHITAPLSDDEPPACPICDRTAYTSCLSCGWKREDKTP